jgi:hypothetical protein
MTYLQDPRVEKVRKTEKRSVGKYAGQNGQKNICSTPPNRLTSAELWPCKKAKLPRFDNSGIKGTG